MLQGDAISFVNQYEEAREWSFLINKCPVSFQAVSLSGQISTAHSADTVNRGQRFMLSIPFGHNSGDSW